MPIDIDATLAELIAPVTPAEFFSEYYNRRTLIVRGARNKFANYFSQETWRSVPMRETSAVYDTTLNGTSASRTIPILPTQVVDLHAAGLLTVGRVDHLKQIQQLMDGLRASLQFPSGKNNYVDKVLCFASKDDAGYRIHWDVHHNFILQIAGRKRWHHGTHPAVRSPLHPPLVAAAGEPAAEYDGQVVLTPELEELAVTELEAGDFLYMPPGVWHAPRAVGETLHLSVAMGYRPLFRMLVDVLKEEFGARSPWRDPFPLILGPERNSGEVPGEIQAIFVRALSALRDELAQMDPRVFHRQWCAEVGEHHGERSRAVTLEPHERLRRPTAVPLRFCVAPSATDAGQTDVYLFSGERTHIALPEAALPFVRALAAHEEFSAGDAVSWDCGLSWDEVSALLLECLARGVLARAQAMPLAVAAE